MSTLDKAIAIAALAHAGQVDKHGQPYILHPLRIMMSMTTEPEKISALLHDVIEDSDLVLEDLRAEGFSEEILTAVQLLTKGEDENYTEYVSRLAHNRLARTVKIADLEDNMDLRRIISITDEDLRRLQRYHWAWHFLSEVK